MLAVEKSDQLWNSPGSISANYVHRLSEVLFDLLPVGRCVHELNVAEFSCSWSEIVFSQLRENESGKDAARKS
jgi:hypothetical protein